MGHGCQHSLAVFSAGLLSIVAPLQRRCIQAVVVLGDHLLPQRECISMKGAALQATYGQGRGYKKQGWHNERDVGCWTQGAALQATERRIKASKKRADAGFIAGQLLGRCRPAAQPGCTVP